MNDNTIVKVAAIGVVALVVAPFVLNAGITLIYNTAAGVTNCVNKVRYKKKIKDGLKDGSIIEFDGQYYEVSV